MAFQTNAILQLFTEDPSIPGSTASAYTITDHNRSELEISYERIEKSDRMADGTMRRFITANKKKISTSWSELPALSGIKYTADGNLGGAFLKSFYEENVYQPVWIKLTYAEESWRSAGSKDNSGNYSQNSTFLPSQLNTTTASSYQVVGASVTVSNFTGTASIAINVPVPYSVNDQIIISGIDTVFNGVFKIAAISDDKKIIKYTTSASPYVPINSFVTASGASTASAYFNMDATYWGSDTTASIAVKNILMTSGSTINGSLWQWLSIPQTNLVVATSTATSVNQNATGTYAVAMIKNTTGTVTKTISPFYSAIVSPVVSTDVIKCFITNFDYKIKRRLTLTDYVDISLELTEI